MWRRKLIIHALRPNTWLLFLPILFKVWIYVPCSMPDPWPLSDRFIYISSLVKSMIRSPLTGGMFLIRLNKQCDLSLFSSFKVMWLKRHAFWLMETLNTALLSQSTCDLRRLLACVPLLCVTGSALLIDILVKQGLQGFWIPRHLKLIVFLGCSETKRGRGGTDRGVFSAVMSWNIGPTQPPTNKM